MHVILLLANSFYWMTMLVHVWSIWFHSIYLITYGFDFVLQCSLRVTLIRILCTAYIRCHCVYF